MKLKTFRGPRNPFLLVVFLAIVWSLISLPESVLLFNMKEKKQTKAKNRYFAEKCAFNNADDLKGIDGQ